MREWEEMEKRQKITKKSQERKKKRNIDIKEKKEHEDEDENTYQIKE